MKSKFITYIVFVLIFTGCGSTSYIRTYHNPGLQPINRGNTNYKLQSLYLNNIKIAVYDYKWSDRFIKFRQKATESKPQSLLLYDIDSVLTVDNQTMILLDKDISRILNLHYNGILYQNPYSYKWRKNQIWISKGGSGGFSKEITFSEIDSITVKYTIPNHISIPIKEIIGIPALSLLLLYIGFSISGN